MCIDGIVIRLALTNPGAHEFHFIASWRSSTPRLWPLRVIKLQVFRRLAAAGGTDFSGAVWEFVGALCKNCHRENNRSSYKLLLCRQLRLVGEYYSSTVLNIVSLLTQSIMVSVNWLTLSEVQFQCE